MQSGITWHLLPVLCALGLISGAGSLLARLLRVSDGHPTFRGRSFATAVRRAPWGWSFVIGAAFVGILLQIPLAIAGHIGHVNFYGMLALCCAMTTVDLFLRWQGTGNQLESIPKVASGTILGWIRNLPIVVRAATLASLVIFVWFAVVKPSITYDARSIFGLKARILYDTGSINDENFRDVDRLNFNANYPLLVPLLEATIFTAEGSQQNIGLQLLFAAFVLAGASVLVSAVRQFESDTIAALWGAAFLLVPLTLAPTEGGGLSGSADYAFAAFATAAVLALSRWLASPNILSAVLAGMLLGAIVLTKQEAVMWLVAVGVAMGATMFMRKIGLRSSIFVRASPIGFIVVGCIALVGCIVRDIPPSPYFRAFGDALRFEWLTQVWTRIPFIVQFAARELCSIRLFGLVWPCSLLALILLRRPTAPMQIVFLRCAIACVAAAYFVAFMLTPLHLEYQLRTALFRLAAHFLPLTMIVAAEQMQAAGFTRQLGELFGKPSADVLPTPPAAEFATETTDALAEPFKLPQERRRARAA